MTTGRAAVNDVAPDDDVLVAAPASVSGRAHTRLSNDVPTACSRALALVTPESQILPEITEPLLVPAATRHVRRAFSGP